MFCGKCGNELREGAKFCHKCGTAVALEPNVIAEPIADTSTEPIQEVTPEVAPVAEVQESQTVPVEQPIKSVRVTKATQSGSSKQKPTVRLKAVAPAPMAKESEPKQEKQPTPSKEEIPNNLTDTAPVENNMTAAESDAQSSVIQTGAAYIAAVAGGIKEAWDKTGVHCESCGARLKSGVKFCPQCGKPTGLPDKEPIDIQSKIQEGGAKAAEAASKAGAVVASKLEQWKEATEEHGNQKTKQTTIAYRGENGDISSAVNPKIKKKWSRKRKIAFGAAAVFVLVIVISSFGGKDGLVSNENPFGLAFDMSVEEYIERHNTGITKSIESSDSSREEKENMKLLYESTGVYMSKEQLEKGNLNTYGEDTFLHFVYNENGGTLVSVSLSTFENKVTSVTVSIPTGYETSAILGKAAVAAMLTAVDPTQDSTVNDNLNAFGEWTSYAANRLSTGEQLPINIYENDVCYTINGSDSMMYYMARAMSDEGYKTLTGQTATSEQETSSRSDNEAEILAELKELPLSDYVGVSSAKLFSAIGVTGWSLGEVSDNTITANVYGNGMRFNLVLNTDRMTYKVESANINGASVTGQECAVLCESLLDSAYDACGAGYF